MQALQGLVIVGRLDARTDFIPQMAGIDGDEVQGGHAGDISGLLGRCLQHETDHLRGMVYLDRVPRLRRVKAMRRFAGTREDR